MNSDLSNQLSLTALAIPLKGGHEAKSPRRRYEEEKE